MRYRAESANTLHMLHAPDISVVVPCGREGYGAHATLRSVERAVGRAVAAGLRVEVVVSLGEGDPETQRICRAFAATREWRCEPTSKTGGGMRNEAVSRCTGTALVFLEGGDLCSADWLVTAYARLGRWPRTILHPEFVVDTGGAGFVRVLGQSSPFFRAESMMVLDPWPPCSCAFREIYLLHPYEPSPRDAAVWHWHCQTVAAGIPHETVPDTGLYTSRPATPPGSVLVARSDLFETEASTGAVGARA